jgi:hypothetical protein
MKVNAAVCGFAVRVSLQKGGFTTRRKLPACPTFVVEMTGRAAKKCHDLENNVTGSKPCEDA